MRADSDQKPCGVMRADNTPCQDTDSDAQLVKTPVITTYGDYKPHCLMRRLVCSEHTLGSGEAKCETLECQVDCGCFTLVAAMNPCPCGYYGDPVNLAARLEAHTKVVGKPILIDETTRQGLSDPIAVEDVGTVALAGKTQPVHVYAVKP